jgi:hypothetical protein
VVAARFYFTATALAFPPLFPIKSNFIFGTNQNENFSYFIAQYKKVADPGYLGL